MRKTGFLIFDKSDYTASEAPGFLILGKSDYAAPSFKVK